MTRGPDDALQYSESAVSNADGWRHSDSTLGKRWSDGVAERPTDLFT